MKIFVLIVAAFFAFSAHADGISDPKHILEQSDEFLGKVSFDDAFRVHDQARIENTGCNFGFCVAPTDIDAEVIAVDAAEAQIRYSVQNGNYADQEIARAEYEANHENLLRLRLSKIDLEPRNYLRIDSGEEVSYRLITGATVHAFRVNVTKISYFENSNQYLELPFSFTVGKDLPGVATLLESHYLGERVVEKVQWVIRPKP